MLLIATFAYNNSVHSAIDKTSNELLSEYVAIFDTEPEDRFLRKEALLAVKRANWLQETRSHLMDLWKNVVEQQAKYYNKQHKNKIYQFDDKVLLRSLNVRTLRPKKKIDHRQLGSFEIIEKIKT